MKITKIQTLKEIDISSMMSDAPVLARVEFQIEPLEAEENGVSFKWKAYKIEEYTTSIYKLIKGNKIGVDENGDDVFEMIKELDKNGEEVKELVVNERLVVIDKVLQRKVIPSLVYDNAYISIAKKMVGASPTQINHAVLTQGFIGYILGGKDGSGKNPFCKGYLRSISDFKIITQ